MFKKINFSASLVCISIFLSGNALAQFPNLKDLAEKLKQAQQQVTPPQGQQPQQQAPQQQVTSPQRQSAPQGQQPQQQLSQPPVTQTISSSLSIPSSAEICTKLKNSVEVKEYASFIKRLEEDHYDQRIYRTGFETKDGLIKKWADEQLRKNGWYGDKIKELDRNIKQCIITLHNDDLIYAFLYSFSSSFAKQVNQKISIEKNKANSLNRTLNSDGSISTSSGNSNIRPEILDNVNISRTLVVILFLDNESNIFKNVYPEIKEEIKVALTNLDATLAQYKKNEQDKQLASKIAEEGEAKKIKEYLENYKIFIEKPEGKLTTGYQWFQTLQTCNEVRKGMALQFVNDNELSESKKKISTIEAKLKSELKDKDTNKLWAEALKRNQKFSPYEGTEVGAKLYAGGNMMYIDLIEYIKVNNKQDWSSSQKTCASALLRFEDFSKSIIGTETPKKSF